MLDIRILLLIGIPAVLAIVNGIQCYNTFVAGSILLGISNLLTTIFCAGGAMLFFSVMKGK